MKNQKVLDNLIAKANESFDNKVRMPSIKSIHNLLDELGIQHYFDGEKRNIVESRRGQSTYVNDRHEGKLGKMIEIKEPHIKLDSSDSYYSWNSQGYARRLVNLINEKQNV